MGSSKKMTKARLGLMPLVFSLSNHADPKLDDYELLSRKVVFKFRRIKNESKVAIFSFLERLPTPSIRCIKSDKHRQTHFNDS